MLRYPGASSINIIDHLKPSLRKAPDEIIIHSVTKNINNVNYLSNVKKIVRLVRETSKDSKLFFSSIICRTDVKDIDRKINETNNHFGRNYCKRQNLRIINNKNINKSDLAARDLHLKEREGVARWPKIL